MLLSVKFASFRAVSWGIYLLKYHVSDLRVLYCTLRSRYGFVVLASHYHSSLCFYLELVAEPT